MFTMFIDNVKVNYFNREDAKYVELVTNGCVAYYRHFNKVTKETKCHCAPEYRDIIETAWRRITSM